MNAREFIIEHSIDRTKWSAIGRVKAKGNGNSVNTYSFEHVTPALGYNFYRLIAVDIDGRTNKTQIIQITNAIKPMPLQVYPNPVTNGIINIRLQQPAMVKIFGAAGEIMLNKQLGMGIQQLNLQHLKPGIYRINILNETISFLKL